MRPVKVKLRKADLGLNSSLKGALNLSQYRTYATSLQGNHATIVRMKPARQVERLNSPLSVYS